MAKKKPNNKNAPQKPTGKPAAKKHSLFDDELFDDAEMLEGLDEDALDAELDDDTDETDSADRDEMDADADLDDDDDSADSQESDGSDDWDDDAGDDEWEEIDPADAKAIADGAAGRFAVTPRRERGPAEEEVQIIHQDDAILVINKPTGLDSVRGQYSAESVLDRLATMLPGRGDDLRIVHRLDRDASGLMVLALTLEAQRHLTAQWMAASVEKVYQAIVRGRLEPPEGTITLPLRMTGKRVKPVAIGGRTAKRSRTDYRVLNQFREFAVVEARPHTGRMHQIRAHLAAIGAPIVCDSHYGTAEPVMLSKIKRGFRPSGRHKERPLIARLGLHSRLIVFAHPTTGETVTYEATLPKDMATTLAQLSKCSR